MLRFSDGGDYEFTPDRAQVGWSLSAGLLSNGTKYRFDVCIQPTRETGTISADDPTELHLAEFPRF